MKGLIFAAGKGTRLRPLTDSIPKALVPVGGVPMLERVICKLRDAGVSPFVVNACYLGDQIEAYVATHDLGAPVAVSVEKDEEPLETGGGIRHARKLLEGSRFLAHNADILSDLDVAWFMSCDRPDSLATLLVTEKEADRYLLFDDDMQLVGWTNVRTGEVKSPHPGLDVAACRRYSFCGVHIISDAVFPLMDSWPERFGIIDFYLSACKDHPICGVVADDIHIIDIGSPETLEAANRLFE